MSIDVTPLSTFKTVATAWSCIFLKNEEQLEQLSEDLNKQDFIVIGSGSNVLFIDDYAGIVVVNQLRGIKTISETASNVIIRVAAGEIWHDTVIRLTQQGFHGLENLALIPGTVGAAPVQNIGAYGVEVEHFIQSIYVYDLHKKCSTTIMACECGFSYRDSAFKSTAWRKRYIILSVDFKLSQSFDPILNYEGLIKKGTPKTAQELINLVVSIRQSKLPDPKKIPNAGSFFKNPLIERQHLLQIQSQHPDIPFFTTAADADNHLPHHVKISAAWLIEQAGFKGLTRSSGAGVYQHHALILVNHGNATGKEIYQLACDIMRVVKERFNVTLVPEVRFV